MRALSPGPWSFAHDAAKHAREMALIRESRIQGDRRNRPARVGERFASAMDAQTAQVVPDRATGCAVENTGEVRRVYPGEGCEFRERRRTARFVVQLFEYACQPRRDSDWSRLPACRSKQLKRCGLQGKRRGRVRGHQLALDAALQGIRVRQSQPPIVIEQTSNGGIVGERTIEMDIQAVRFRLAEVVRVAVSLGMHHQDAAFAGVGPVAGCLVVRTLGDQTHVRGAVFVPGQFCPRPCCDLQTPRLARSSMPEIAAASWSPRPHTGRIVRVRQDIGAHASKKYPA